MDPMGICIPGDLKKKMLTSWVASTDSTHISKIGSFPRVRVEIQNTQQLKPPPSCDVHGDFLEITSNSMNDWKFFNGELFVAPDVQPFQKCNDLESSNMKFLCYVSI